VLGLNYCQRIAESPNDTFVNLNGNVLLNCIVDNYNSDEHFVEWCKNDFCTWGRIVELDIKNYYFKSLPKYFIKGNINKGNSLDF
jgi:hypothetical protein